MKRKMMTRFSAGFLALLLTFGSVCSVQAAKEQNNGEETQTAVEVRDGTFPYVGASLFLLALLLVLLAAAVVMSRRRRSTGEKAAPP